MGKEDWEKMNWVKATLFLVCLNLATWMVVQMDVAGVNYIASSNPQSYASTMESTIEAFRTSNPNALVSNMFGYIIPAFTLIWNLIGWTFATFPTFLSALGVPTVITVPLQVLWYIVIGVGIAEFFRGFKTTE